MTFCKSPSPPVRDLAGASHLALTSPVGLLLPGEMCKSVPEGAMLLSGAAHAARSSESVLGCTPTVLLHHVVGRMTSTAEE